MLALVQQQQELLGRQKSVQEASQRHSRVLQEQRQQLEAALRQNSVLQSQNKVNILCIKPSVYQSVIDL